MPQEMQTRMMTMEVEKTEDSNYTVRGYATTFNPYVLFEDENGKVYEQIHREAFKNAKMNDVIMQYDHNGTIFARQSNGTLELSIDEHGLFIKADLSKTEASRRLYEQIKTGMITKMSWAFFIAPEGRTYDRNTRTIHINNVREVLDVSAVSRPANDSTEISARSFLNGLKEQDQEAKELKRKKLNLLLKLGG